MNLRSRTLTYASSLANRLEGGSQRLIRLCISLPMVNDSQTKTAVLNVCLVSMTLTEPTINVATQLESNHVPLTRILGSSMSHTHGNPCPRSDISGSNLNPRIDLLFQPIAVFFVHINLCVKVSFPTLAPLPFSGFGKGGEAYAPPPFFGY